MIYILHIYIYIMCVYLQIYICTRAYMDTYKYAAHPSNTYTHTYTDKVADGSMTTATILRYLKSPKVCQALYWLVWGAFAELCFSGLGISTHDIPKPSLRTPIPCSPNPEPRLRLKVRRRSCFQSGTAQRALASGPKPVLN